MNTRKILLELLLCLFFVSGMSAQNYVKTTAYQFSFPEGKDLLLADYGDNAFALQEMNTAVQAARVPLFANECHLLIVVHVGAYDFGHDEVVNEASLRASRLRAYLKLNLNIPHECVAFYIDRSGRFRDQAHVYLVREPLPWFANQEILYSESRYPNAMKEVLGQYGSVPYVELFSRGSMSEYDRLVYVIHDDLFQREELEDYRLAVSEKPVKRITTVVTTTTVEEPVAQSATSRSTKTETETAITEQPASQPTRVSAVKATPAEERAIPAPGHAPQAGFSLGIKTNLLPWLTVAPSVELGNGPAKVQTGSIMPNAGLELYFAGRWSVVASGMYANFTYGDKKTNNWSVSSFKLNPRIWPLEHGAFRWLNAGVFGQYGDFDVRGTKIGGEGLYGRTGRFWTAGGTVACLVPLGAGFCFEAELSGGYRSVYDGKKYRYDPADKKNYKESVFQSTGFTVGLNLNIVYRFGFK